MRRFAIVFAPLVVSCASAPPPASTSTPTSTPTSPSTSISTFRRVVVSLTRPSGSSVTTVAPDGAIAIAYDFFQNGRGPHVDARVRFAADGTIASYEGHGHHEMGTPVDETFSIEAGRARWKSHEEQGDRETSRAAFFVPIEAPPEVLGWLASAALKAGGRIPLWPDGEARVERTGETTVTVAGRTKHLAAYAITGLEVTPARLWMEDDGSYFGVATPWFSCVPEGWDGAIRALIDAQKKMELDRDARLARTLAHRPPAAGLALAHARVLDVERGAWLADQTVVVVGDSIAAVGPSKTTKVPAGAETIDASHLAVLPGLWDMHAHLGIDDGVLDVASGVTTARDVGNSTERLDDFKKRFDDGTAIGPHVVRFGFVEGRNEKAAAAEVTAENEAEAKAAVETFAKRGYEGIKIYNSVRPELVPLIAKEAHDRGMQVTGHVPVHMLASEAVRAGYDGIEHVNMLLLNFFATHDTDTRTPLRFSIVGDRAAEFDWKSSAGQEFIALVREHRVVVDPTLGAFEDLLVAQPGKVIPGLEWVVERLPLQARRAALVGGLPAADKQELYARSFAKIVETPRLLRDAGVTVVTGTDALAGLMLDHEIDLFVRGGMAPIDAIRAATIVPARAMKMDKKSGSIAPGKAADLVVVEGDPLARTSDLRNVRTTIRAGVVFAARDLFEAVGVKQAP